jgi:uncharacterized protein (DUF934 family)
MPLIKRGKRVDDPWILVGDDESIPTDTPVIVTLEHWRSKKSDLIARGAGVGVLLHSDEPPSNLADDLESLEVIALDFPTFRDGRAYSYARILRENMGYEGEIRAVGDVLLEQLHYMDRVGFDAFEIGCEDAVEAWVTAGKDITVWYQPGADQRQTAMDLRRRR